MTQKLPAFGANKLMLIQEFALRGYIATGIVVDITFLADMRQLTLGADFPEV